MRIMMWRQMLYSPGEGQGFSQGSGCHLLYVLLFVLNVWSWPLVDVSLNMLM